MILSILLPDEGTVTLFGGEAASRALSMRIGYLPEERGLYRRMIVQEHLVFLAEIKGIPRARARELTKHWLARLGLSDWGKRRVEFWGCSKSAVRGALLQAGAGTRRAVQWSRSGQQR
jgi:ABC-2 type transport system ATP-binding protein